MNHSLISFLGFTIDVIGKIMVSYTVVRVHYRFWKEHKIDEKVFQEMRLEQLIGLFGIALIIIGYILQVPGKLN